MRYFLIVFIILITAPAQAIDFATVATFIPERIEDTFIDRAVSYGDIDGDGKQDLLITTYSAYDNEITLNIFYGDFWEPEMNTGNSDVAISSTNMTAIESVWARGDVDDDGKNDILFHSESEVFFFYGAKLRSFLTPNDADIIFQSAEEVRIRSVTCGDINGDMYDDIIIGAEMENLGYVYIFYNEVLTPTIDLERADLIIEAEEEGDDFGASLFVIPDLTGDKHNELLVGAPQAFGTGAVYLFQRAFQSGEIVAYDADVVFYGKNKGDQFGFDVYSGVELNGDELTDILIMAPLADDQEPDVGAVYVYLGTDFWNEVDVDNANAIVSGNGAGDKFGLGIAPLNDLDEDKKDELVVSSNWAITAEDQVGRLFLLTGDQLNTRMKAIEAKNYISGVVGEMWYNGSITPAGDIDADGHSDFFVRAQRMSRSREMEQVLMIMSVW